MRPIKIHTIGRFSAPSCLAIRHAAVPRNECPNTEATNHLHNELQCPAAWEILPTKRGCGAHQNGRRCAPERETTALVCKKQRGGFTKALRWFLQTSVVVSRFHYETSPLPLATLPISFELHSRFAGAVPPQTSITYSPQQPCCDQHRAHFHHPVFATRHRQDADTIRKRNQSGCSVRCRPYHLYGRIER